MTYKAIVLPLIISTIFSVPTLADEYADGSLALCEKIKSCALAQMGSQEITPEIRQMMQPMLDGMCSNMMVSMPEVAESHAMYKPAMACMKSLEALSCEQMQQTSEANTPACKEYEALAEKYQSP
jgi:hypothetical protein